MYVQVINTKNVEQSWMQEEMPGWFWRTVHYLLFGWLYFSVHNAQAGQSVYRHWRTLLLGYISDAHGNHVFVGDTVALYGLMDDDGYNADPELDTRQRGHIRTTSVRALDAVSIQDDQGHWWPSWDIIKVEDS